MTIAGLAKVRYALKSTTKHSDTGQCRATAEVTVEKKEEEVQNMNEELRTAGSMLKRSQAGGFVPQLWVLINLD